NNAFLRIVNTPKRDIGPATLQKLGEWAQQREVSLFKASFDVGLEQTLQGKRLAILREFVSWLQQLAQQAERDPLSAVESLIAGLHYDSWLYETAPSAKAAEMRLKNVELLYKWLTDMIKGDELNE